MSGSTSHANEFDRRVSAYHQAGHAVMAAAVGFDVYECWIARDGSGEVRFRSRWASNAALLAVTVGGSCAESILLDRADLGSVESFMEGVALMREGDGEGDAREAGLLLRDHTAVTATELLRRARDFARQVLSDDWADVEAIAGCLL